MPPSPDPPWLPDLCRPHRLLAILIAAQGVVVVAMLAPIGAAAPAPGEFLAASSFCLWATLVSVAVLCSVKERLSRLPRTLGALSAWLVPVVVAGLGAALVREISVAQAPADAEASPWLVTRVVLLSALLSAAVLRYLYVRDQWSRQVQAQAKAELAALQARINPHFLFNSINAIASLIGSRPGIAEEALQDLSDLFRAALGAGKGESTLEEEIQLAKRYLAIESLRLGDRLGVEWSIDPLAPMSMAMPRLTLQPLLENAVIHGISRLGHGGTIRIGVKPAGRELVVTVDNPRPEGPPAQSGGTGHALENTAARLRHFYGESAGVLAESLPGRYRCELSMPIPASPPGPPRPKQPQPPGTTR